MWFAREVISLAPCQFNILFLEEKKKEKTLGNISYFAWNDMLWKKKKNN